MKIISFEGVEGVGKSTQITMLDSYLESKGLSTAVLREPGSTQVGENIREILLNTAADLSNESELLLQSFILSSQVKMTKSHNNSVCFVVSSRLWVSMSRQLHFKLFIVIINPFDDNHFCFCSSRNFDAATRSCRAGVDHCWGIIPDLMG